MFELHPQLANDCITVGYLPLCQVLLAKDSNYPWLILVPQRPAITEVFQLSEQDQLQLAKESALVSQCLFEAFKADKMNVAALGNMVPQLHVHHIVRFKTDAAWPRPVWGAVAANNYSDESLVEQCDVMRSALSTMSEVFAVSHS
jgi:diadenosine tetraphosphate (Ap4A) HIT family hydrolase